MIIYIHSFSIFSGDDEDSANQKRKRILQSQRPVDSDGNGFGSDELFSKYALCYKFENSQIFSKKKIVSRGYRLIINGAHFSTLIKNVGQTMLMKPEKTFKVHWEFKEDVGYYHKWGPTFQTD